MDFSFKPTIDKDYILKNISEEEIFSYYLGFPIKSGKLFVSLLRNDKNPTCSFYRNKSNTLCYHDFATGDIFNCFSYVCRLFGCTYHQAIKKIAEDFNLLNTKSDYKPKYTKVEKIKEKKQTFINVEIKDFAEHELKWWNSFGITKDILNKFKVYSCKTVFLNNSIFAQSTQHAPIYGYYGGKVQESGNKIELWRIYFPKTKDSIRFIGNWPSKKIQGWEQLPKKGKLCVITKSMKDVMCLYSLNIPAVAPCSETQFLSDTQVNELKSRFQHIVVLFDLDHTGIQFSKKIKKEYPELIVTLLPRTGYCKDISDYYNKYKRDKTIEMIKTKIQSFKNERLL